ncbi:hypothetical protein QZH41_019461, partial [Actinostola sp. cb2023]
ETYLYYILGTVYEKALHYWPLKSSSSLVDVITCQNVLNVHGTVSTVTSSDGLYGISTNGRSGVKLPTSSQDQECLKSFTACSDGLSIALWINLLASTKSHASRFDVVLATQDALSPLQTGLAILDNYDHGLQVSVRTNNYTETKTIPIQRNVWSHVVITWTADDNITYYVNSKTNAETNDTSLEYVTRTTDNSTGLYLAYSTVAGQSSARFRDLAIWNRRISEKEVRDIYHHTPGCQEISRSQWKLSASSYADHYIPDSAGFDSTTAWCEDPLFNGGYLEIRLPYVYQRYLEIRLPYVYQIKAMVLRGKQYGTQEYVRSFKVMLSVNAIEWDYYKVNGAIKTFTGLTSAENLKRIPTENPTIVARYVRIYPTQATGRKCIRIRLCGVKQDSLNISAAITRVLVNGTAQCTIKVNTKEYCPDKDGHNVIAFNHQTGRFVGAKNFETNKHDNAGQLLQQFIDSLANGTLIVVAVKHSGHRISQNGSKALYETGAKSLNAPPTNTSWILIGHKGSLQKWIQEKLATSAGGTVMVEAVIPFGSEIQPSHFWPLGQIDYYRPYGPDPLKPSYWKSFRDIPGGMDLYHNSGAFKITMGLLRVGHVSAMYSFSKSYDCFLRPQKCVGGVTVSVWLKFEHLWLLHGEKDEPWDRITYHMPEVIVSSWTSGYIQIERKTYTANIGHTVILMDYATGQITGQAVFDIPNDITAQDRFAHFINTAPNGTVVLVCARVSSTLSSATLINALKNLGAKDPALTTQQSYLFVGYKGLDTMDWVEELKVPLPSSILRKRIPLGPFTWMIDQPQPFKQEILAGPKALVFHDQTVSKSDIRIVSSSVRSERYKTENAALYNSKSLNSNGCWCPMTDQNQYLSVYLSERSLVTSIDVQGCPTSNEWVTQFIIKHKDGDGSISTYLENGITKNFRGSVDRHTVVVNDFNHVVYATVIEIHPSSWHVHACMRFELFGYPLQSACFGPLGMSNTIPQKRISASSFVSPFLAQNARLGVPTSAWCVDLHAPNYLEIDLGEPTVVSGIATQGYDNGTWTKSFYIGYSHNSLVWFNHTRDNELGIYKGNQDRTSVAINMIDPSMETRYVRVYPIEGSQPYMACLRVELYGCFKENPKFVLTGPVEINAANSSDITIFGSYRFCPRGIPQCPRCKRQIYTDVFGTTKCVVNKVLYDCRYHQFEALFRVPFVPNIYNIRVFDSIGQGCNVNMKRTVSGKIVGRVLAKAYNSTSCLDVLLKGHRNSGVYRIRPTKIDGPMISVFCDQMRHGGGWTVLQRRINGTVDFFKTWREYKNGFGSLEGEFWLGNDNFHRLASSPVELLIEMETFSGFYYYAKYDSFQIENESAKYKIHVSGYSGSAGDSLTFHNGSMFSTKDQDNDPGTEHDCPNTLISAWWFNQCKQADLNTIYVSQESGTSTKGLKWHALLGKNKNLKSVEIKVRPKQDSPIKCYNWGCFYLINGRRFNFNSARQACWSMGGDLATIKNASEASDIASMMKAAGVSSAIIGLNDIVEEGKTQGVDGSISDYSNWASSTSSAKDCVVLSTDTMLQPASCTSSYYGCVCQRAIMCYKASCYQTINTLSSRDDARTACQQLGLKLIKIPSASKSEFIQKYMMPNPRVDLWMGSLGGTFGRTNSMKFSTIDKDNDYVTNKSCAQTFGPGWLWTRIYKMPNDCYHMGVNLFGPYSPSAIGSENTTLYHYGFDRPITYMELKIRRYHGKNSVFTLEGDITHWNQDITNKFNWTLNSNSTPSKNTGPSFDHTYHGMPQGNKYGLPLTIHIMAYRKIAITGVVGADYTSDMAIDDLSITTSECSASKSCVPDCKEGFVCLKDKGACDCHGMKHVDASCNYVLNQSVFQDTAHHWPLDDPTNITNIQGTIHGFTTGNVVAVRGPVNSALVTDGITGRITLADMSTSCILSSPSCSSGFTLRFWLKFPENDEKQRRIYLSVGHDKKKSRGLQFLQDFSIIDSSSHLVVNATIDQLSCVIGFQVYPSIWSTITLSWAKSSGFTLYHNGKNVTRFLVHKCESVISVSPTNTLFRTGYESTVPALQLDDVTLWYKELKDPEIVKIFRFFTAPQNSITLSVKFSDETFIDRLQDRESDEFKSFNAKLLQNAQTIFAGKSNHFEGIYIVQL